MTAPATTARGGNHQVTMRTSPKGVYGPLMAETNAVVAAALARVDRAPTRRLPARCTRWVVELRTGSRTEIRTYGSSPIRAAIMDQVLPLADPRLNPGFVRPQFLRPAAGDGQPQAGRDCRGVPPHPAAAGQPQAGRACRGVPPHPNAAGTATAGRGDATAAATPLAAVSAASCVPEGSGETSRPGLAAGHSELRRISA